MNSRFDNLDGKISDIQESVMRLEERDRHNEEEKIKPFQDQCIIKPLKTLKTYVLVRDMLRILGTGGFGVQLDSPAPVREQKRWHKSVEGVLKGAAAMIKDAWGLVLRRQLILGLRLAVTCGNSMSWKEWKMECAEGLEE
ncbi:hypothetical protein M9H77_13640 [Catharanthus roseus]|uniref:Uncharacterized protein n=1 Tax=Catharanthus roseus TaxID=4058 RepID=A0ACC0BKS9_CATRO|nr:hypothetical protein M9H77_13640 [Catharanthus roseus]